MKGEVVSSESRKVIYPAQLLGTCLDDYSMDIGVTKAIRPYLHWLWSGPRSSRGGLREACSPECT